MPPKAVQRTKEQKLAAAIAGSRKGKKKKWSKGRVREKKNNAIIFTPSSYESACKDIPKMKNITVATVSEKLRISGSLALRFIRKLAKEGEIKKVYDSNGFLLYTRDEKKEDKKEDKKEEKQSKGKKKKADVEAEADVDVGDVLGDIPVKEVKIDKKNNKN